MDSEHAIRNSIVLENFSDISNAYKTLYDYSRNARYYCCNIENMQMELCKAYLIKIIKWADNNHNTDIKINI